MPDRVKRPAAPSRSSVNAGCVILLLFFVVAAALLHWITGLGYVAGFFVAIFVSLVFVYAFYWIGVHKQNRRAKGILRDILSGHVSEFVLYLRQFQSTKWQWGFQITWKRRVIWQGERTDLHRLWVPDWFEKILGDIPLLHVAEKINVRGGSIRLSNAEWQETVLRLVMVAKAIIVVPGIGKGVLWEISQIKTHGRLPVTVFFMPPESTDSGEEGGLAVLTRTTREHRPAETLWRLFAPQFEGVGLRLPAYDPEGLFFRFDRDGTSLRDTLRLTTATVEDLRAFVLGQADSD